ncbi:MAG: hypothetical protein ACJA1A_003207 [Saprospiraceae bacterium]|jgi:hypothetical protein|tara:strand:+ start:1136 stop:1807 length:672 start_codon:yes stop_codon:yes gene_type:complete
MNDFIKVVIILFAINFVSCCSTKECPRYFIVHAEILNPKIEYKVGDTISIVSNFSSIVSAVTSLPRISAGEYEMSGIDWEPVSRIYKVDSFGLHLESKTINYVEFISNSNFNYSPYVFNSGNSWLNGEYNEDNGYFNLEVDFIAKEPGTYCLFQGSNLLTSTQEFPDKCSGVGFDVEVIMNNGEDNNIDLLKESPNPHWNTRIFEKPDERFYRAGGYCFRIVE